MIIKNIILENKNRIYYLITDIILVLFFAKIYRPYIYINNINDYHIADSILNIFAVLIMSNFICIKEKDKENLLYVISVVLGLIVYEALQYYLNIGTFDMYDITFTLFGGVISFFMNEYLYKLNS